MFILLLMKIFLYLSALSPMLERHVAWWWHLYFWFYWF